MVQTTSLHGTQCARAAQLSKRLGSVWNYLWGNALKRSPGIIRKSRVSYPVPGFLSSATWPSLPRKHYNGLKKTTVFWLGDMTKNDYLPYKNKVLDISHAQNITLIQNLFLRI